MRIHHPCDFATACHILWGVWHMGWTQTHAAIVFRVNSGTVSHIVNGHRFPEAYPVAPHGL